MIDIIAKHNQGFLGRGGKVLRVRIIDNTPVNYGLLYNWLAAANYRGIAPTGWHLPSKTEFETMATTLGGSSIAGGHMKADGTTYWTTDNADNSSGFDARGTGTRSYSTGAYSNLGTSCLLWTSTIFDSTDVWIGYLSDSSTEFSTSGTGNKLGGASVRLIKDDSTDPGTMMDYEGHIYPTVKIGDQVWMAENLVTQKWNTGEDIPYCSADVTWTELTVGAFCFPNGNVSNV